VAVFSIFFLKPL